MRQAYLELAILYLLSSGENIAPLAEAGSTMESVNVLGDSVDDVTKVATTDDASSVTSGGAAASTGRDSRTSTQKKKKWKVRREVVC